MEAEPAAGPYRCIRCDHSEYEAGEVRAPGGFWTAVVNVESRTFITLTCTACKHTELFEAERDELPEILGKISH